MSDYLTGGEVGIVFGNGEGCTDEDRFFANLDLAKESSLDIPFLEEMEYL